MKTLNKTKEYKVHPEDVDVRGWNLMLADVKVGTVKDLVIDEDRYKVKYLDVLRKDGGFNYHYLIPMNEVFFDRHNKQVTLERYSHHFIDTYPTYTDIVPADYEERVANYYSNTERELYSGKPRKSFENSTYEEDQDFERRRYSDEKTAEGLEKPFFKRDYERTNPANREERINQLEKQKQLRKLEYERDIAVLDKEIVELKALK